MICIAGYNVLPPTAAFFKLLEICVALPAKNKKKFSRNVSRIGSRISSLFYRIVMSYPIAKSIHHTTTKYMRYNGWHSPISYGCVFSRHHYYNIVLLSFSLDKLDFKIIYEKVLAVNLIVLSLAEKNLQV